MYHQKITVYLPRPMSGDRFRVYVEPENLLREYDTKLGVWNYIEQFTVNAQHRTFALEVIQES